MWNNYEQKVGLQNVYKSRWQFTSRDKSSIYIQKNIPSVSIDFINTKIGKESFNQVSIIPSKKFEELYNPYEWKILGQLINKPDDEMNKFFGQMKMKEININVPAPGNNSSTIEYILIISLLLIFTSAKLIFKNILWPHNDNRLLTAPILKNTYYNTRLKAGLNLDGPYSALLIKGYNDESEWVPPNMGARPSWDFCSGKLSEQDRTCVP